jgi:hypothetical protein
MMFKGGMGKGVSPVPAASSRHATRYIYAMEETTDKGVMTKFKRLVHRPDEVKRLRCSKKFLKALDREMGIWYSIDSNACSIQLWGRHQESHGHEKFYPERHGGMHERRTLFLPYPKTLAS